MSRNFEARLSRIEQTTQAFVEAARRVLAGEALNSIARDLTRRGFTAADGAAAFYTRRLQRILRAPRVAGLRSYKGEVVREATWPAMALR